eukprot:2185414-Alexandrium_andersonii.AAC.1
MTSLDSSSLGRFGRARVRVSVTACTLPPPPSATLQLTARMVGSAWAWEVGGRASATHGCWP